MVQAVGHTLGVGVVVFIKLHGVPAVLSPVLPVLDDDVKWQLLLLETIDGLQNLLLRMVSFAAVDVASSPTGQEGSPAR